MTAQTALEIADSLDSIHYHPEAHEAAKMLRQQHAEIERLQRIIDSRPAINDGLPETYIKWSQGIYASEYVQDVGHDA